MELFVGDPPRHLDKIPVAQICRFLRACWAAWNLSLPETAAASPSL